MLEIPAMVYVSASLALVWSGADNNSQNTLMHPPKREATVRLSCGTKGARGRVIPPYRHKQDHVEAVSKVTMALAWLGLYLSFHYRRSPSRRWVRNIALFHPFLLR